MPPVTVVLLLATLAPGLGTAIRITPDQADQLLEPHLPFLANALTAASTKTYQDDARHPFPVPITGWLPSKVAPRTWHPQPTPTPPPPTTHTRSILADHPHHKHQGLVYFGFSVPTLAEQPLNPTTIAAHARVALTCESTANVLALLRYSASCALSPTQNVTVTVPWATGTKTIVLEGGMGMAPGWADAPLDEQQQRYVTACLAARTNLLSKKVEVSLRIPDHFPSGGPEEVKIYPVLEGAFWGNMFSRRNPGVYSCSGADPNTPRLSNRFCAHGRLPQSRRQHGEASEIPPPGSMLEFCGDIRPLGPCGDVCSGLSDDGYSECRGQKEVMTVYLKPVTLQNQGSQ